MGGYFSLLAFWIGGAGSPPVVVTVFDRFHGRVAPGTERVGEVLPGTGYLGRVVE